MLDSFNFTRPPVTNFLPAQKAEFPCKSISRQNKGQDPGPQETAMRFFLLSTFNKKNEDDQMKFTKTAFRAALKANDQTEVWRLVSLKIGSKLPQIIIIVVFSYENLCLEGYFRYSFQTFCLFSATFSVNG